MKKEDKPLNLGGYRGGGFRISGFKGLGVSKKHNIEERYEYDHQERFYYRFKGLNAFQKVMYAVLTLIILGLVASILISPLILSTPKTHELKVGPRETHAFETNNFWFTGIKVNDLNGLIETHFFDNQPPVDQNTVNRIINDQRIVRNNNFIYWEFFLLKASTINIEWSSKYDVIFWIVTGNDRFDDWESGKPVDTKFQSDVSLNHKFIADSDTDYYFIFQSTWITTTLNVTFEINAKVYDISNSNRVKIGSFSQSESKESYIVFFNPSFGNDIAFSFQEVPRISGGEILIGEFIIIIILVLITNRLRGLIKSKHKLSPKSPLNYPQNNK